MDSRSRTMSQESTSTVGFNSNSRTMSASDGSPADSTHTPPPHLFRLIKRLSPTTYLCFPRDIDLSPATPPGPSTEVTAFTTLPNKNVRMHQQAWNFDHPWNNVLVWMMQHNGASLLHPRVVKLLPQAVIVTMGNTVRRECEALEEVNKHGASSLHVLAMLKAQLTEAPESKWLVTAPVFGLTLEAFGKNEEAAGGMANWLVAHIFLGLLDSVAYVHASGMTLGALTSADVVLDIYPRVVWHRFRGYPDVVLSSFAAAAPADEAGEEEDAVLLLRVMEEVIANWSDAAAFVRHAGVVTEIVTDDPILLVLRDIRLLLTAPSPSLQQVRAQVEARLIDIRVNGPEQLPRSICQSMHSDLAANAEYEHALREPKMLSFQAKREDFVKIMADEPVRMGAGGHAGMKTKQIMAMRFAAKKSDFLRIIGAVEEEQGGTDEDGEFEWDDGYGLEEQMDVDAAGPAPPSAYQSLFGGD